MSYGHADKIARVAATPSADAPPIDPALYRRDDVRRILADRDVAALYLVLKDEGITQRQISELTGQSQSEVSEIVKGRRVLAYDLLVRIAEGLGIPRELMGLSYGEPGAYGGGVGTPQPGPGPGDDMWRRHFLAAGAVLGFGHPALGELLNPLPSTGVPVELPSRLGTADVTSVRDLTAALRGLVRTHGGGADVIGAAAAQRTRLMEVPAPDTVRRDLASALAELHELAGWACFDSGYDSHARRHYAHAVDLATDAGDTPRAASALRYAGVMDAAENPNHALKCYQLAGHSLGTADRDLAAWLRSGSALVLARMGYREQAVSAHAEARDGWAPGNEFERADRDYQAALVAAELGQLDRAEAFAAGVNGGGRHRPVGTFAAVLRATVHVQAGEPRALHMAHSAVIAVSRLRSARARTRLVPLAAALEARSGADAHQLARMARQVATTRV